MHTNNAAEEKEEDEERQGGYDRVKSYSAFTHQILVLTDRPADLKRWESASHWGQRSLTASLVPPIQVICSTLGKKEEACKAASRIHGRRNGLSDPHDVT